VDYSCLWHAGMPILNFIAYCGKPHNSKHISGVYAGYRAISSHQEKLASSFNSSSRATFLFLLDLNPKQNAYETSPQITKKIIIRGKIIYIKNFEFLMSF